mgnify:CR=1 FL=1
MARIILDNLAHSYRPAPRGPEDYALKDLDIAWEDGGAYALLGPSGCGKTTMLNIISGLLRPSRGKVLYDDRDVTALPPERRNIAQVFQFPVLYDTMTVFDNLAFPLRNRGMDKELCRKRVLEVAEILDLTQFLAQRAANLAADAKQKISLGRGLVRSDVAAILFDEPLTVIDPHLKWHLRGKLKDIHKQFNLTMIYVTHDQVEAMTFADKIVVMYEGEIVQVGTPQDLFENPGHTFVGYFIGSPGMNLFPCTVEGDQAVISGGVVPLAQHQARTVARLREGKLELGIRPMFVRLHAQAGSGRMPGRVTQVEDQGSSKIVSVAVDHAQIKVWLTEGAAVPDGGCFVEFPQDRIRLFNNGRLVA